MPRISRTSTPTPSFKKHRASEMLFTNESMATGCQPSLAPGRRNCSITPYSRSNSSAIPRARTHPTQRLLSMRWICSIKTISMPSASFLPIAISHDSPRACVNPTSSFLAWVNRRHHVLSSQPAINSCISMFSKKATSARRASRTLAHASARTLRQNGPSKIRQALLTHPIVASRCALNVWISQTLQVKAA